MKYKRRAEKHNDTLRPYDLIVEILGDRQRVIIIDRVIRITFYEMKYRLIPADVQRLY